MLLSEDSCGQLGTVALHQQSIPCHLTRVSFTQSCACTSGRFHTNFLNIPSSLIQLWLHLASSSCPSITWTIQVYGQSLASKCIGQEDSSYSKRNSKTYQMRHKDIKPINLQLQEKYLFASILVFWPSIFVWICKQSGSNKLFF